MCQIEGHSHLDLMGSIPIARSTVKATRGDRIRVNTLSRWESLGNMSRFGASLIS